ncbi:hypothetical protein B0H15DRAFT_795566 [Mycena belliarum]|uniref:Uncharacterized protein n=1 Tax=Mycena belliarum TaxID=1033014 RepID=A0AAD6ULZ8_9AGAR|nr:hypothetical protein B0H15DRAFT_795566 [Mycena belliae]
MAHLLPPSLVELRNSLLGTNEYVASPTCVPSHSWRNKAGGHIITGGSGFLVVVGRVIDSKLDVVEAGSWREQWKDPMEKAKFVLMLEAPDATVFFQDWAPALSHVSRMDGGICDGQHAKNFIFKDRAGTLLRFTQNVFEKKKEGDPAIPAGYNAANWHMPKDMKATFDDVSTKFHIRPLTVYDTNDVVVDPNTLAQRLVGALCEITYSYKHWEMKDPKGELFDTFTGNVHQLVILQESQSPPLLPAVPLPGGRFRAGRGPVAPMASAPISQQASVGEVPAQPLAPPPIVSVAPIEGTAGLVPPALASALFAPVGALQKTSSGMPVVGGGGLKTPPSTPRAMGLSPTPYSPATPAGFYGSRLGVTGGDGVASGSGSRSSNTNGRAFGF